MTGKKIYETISICLKNLEGEGFLSFKEEEFEKDSEEGNHLKFIRTSKAILVLTKHLSEKGEYEKAEEIIKKEAKILRNFFSAPQRDILNWLILNATLDIHLFSEILYSSNSNKVPEDFLKMDSKSFMEFSRKTFLKDTFNLLKKMESNYNDIRGGFLIRIFFEKILRFSILNFYNTLVDEKNFQEWEYAKHNLKEKIYYGIMSRIQLPNLKSAIERVWLSSALINIRDAYFYYLKNNEFPKNTMDPFTKRPLKFIKKGNSLLIYSLGPDLEDQKGDPVYNLGVFNSKIKQHIGYKIPQK